MNEADPTDNLIAQRIKTIFPDEVTQQKIISLVISKNPIGSSKTSVYPYYKKYYGEWIKPKVDLMISTKETIFFPYKTFCGPNWETQSANTLYSKINQGIRFLVENLDPDGKYHQWNELKNVSKNKMKGGVFIEWIKELQLDIDGKLPEAMMISDTSGLNVATWRRELDEWIESGNDTPFLKERLCLSKQEVYDLKVMLNAVKGIMGSVDSTSVKVIRTN